MPYDGKSKESREARFPSLRECFRSFLLSREEQDEAMVRGEWRSTQKCQERERLLSTLQGAPIEEKESRYRRLAQPEQGDPFESWLSWDCLPTEPIFRHRRYRKKSRF